MKFAHRPVFKVLSASALALALASGCVAAYGFGNGGHGFVGGGHGGFYGGRGYYGRGYGCCGWGWGWAGLGLGLGLAYPYWWGAYGWPDYAYGDPYAYGYAPPVAPMPNANVPPAPSYWYYCPDSKTYYPYVRQCASAWQPVAATPPR